MAPDWFATWETRSITIDVEVVDNVGVLDNKTREITVPCYGFFAVYPVRRLLALYCGGGYSPDLHDRPPDAWTICLIGQGRPIGYAPTEAAGRAVAEAAMAYDLACWQFSRSMPAAQLAACKAKMLTFVRAQLATGLLCESSLGFDFVNDPINFDEGGI